MGQFARQWDMAATEPRVTRPRFPPPQEQKCNFGGSWNLHWKGCHRAHPQQEGVSHANQDQNGIRSRIVHDLRHPRHRILSTSTMAAVMTVSNPALNPRSVPMHRLRKASAFSGLLGSLRMFQRNRTPCFLPEVTAVTGRERSRLGALHDRHVRRSAHLVNPFVSSRSRFVAPPLRGL